MALVRTSTGRRSTWVGLLLTVALLLAACGGDGGPVRDWRDLTLTLPDGWSVEAEGETFLNLADGELGEEPGDVGTREVAAYLTHEPTTIPQDWRTFVEEVEGTLESDEAISVGGAPATKLVFSHASNGVPVREMVVVIPSRGIVMLMQPVVTQGQTDGPEVFVRHREEFELLLSSIRFGAPVDAAPTG